MTRIQVGSCSELVFGCTRLYKRYLSKGLKTSPFSCTCLPDLTISVILVPFCSCFHYLIYVADKAKLHRWELFCIKLYSEIFCNIPQIKEMHWEFKTVFISQQKDSNIQIFKHLKYFKNLKHPFQKKYFLKKYSSQPHRSRFGVRVKFI